MTTPGSVSLTNYSDAELQAEIYRRNMEKQGLNHRVLSNDQDVFISVRGNGDIDPVVKTEVLNKGPYEEVLDRLTVLEAKIDFLMPRPAYPCPVVNFPHNPNQSNWILL